MPTVVRESHQASYGVETRSRDNKITHTAVQKSSSAHSTNKPSRGTLERVQHLFQGKHERNKRSKNLNYFIGDGSVSNNVHVRDQRISCYSIDKKSQVYTITSTNAGEENVLYHCVCCLSKEVCF